MSVHDETGVGEVGRNTLDRRMDDSCAAEPHAAGLDGVGPVDAGRDVAGAVVRIEDVTFAYARGEADGQSAAPALAHAGLRVGAGEVVMLCGQSGCGKTTATRLVNGLIPGFYTGRLSGVIDVCGLRTVGFDGRGGGDDDGGHAPIPEAHASVALDPASPPPIEDYVPLVGSVFQNPKTQHFNADSTAELAFPCENMGWGPSRIRARVAEVAARFGVEELLGRSVFALSGGQRQRLAVAASTMLGPRVMVMDEPTSNLDAVAMRDLHDIVARLKEAGVSVVIAEHRLAWCADLVDRYVLFADGVVAGQWTGREFAALDTGELKSMGLRALDLTSCHESVSRKTIIMDPPACRIDQGGVGDRISYGEGSSYGDGAESNGVVASGDGVDGIAADGEPEAKTSAGSGGGPIVGPGADPGGASNAAAGGGPIIATQGLVVGYRRPFGKPTFSRRVPDVTFGPGRIIGLMGPNGVGKSTFIRTLCGLAKPIAGKVLLHGAPASRPALTKAGFLVMQDVNYQLFADSVREEVLLGAEEDDSGARLRCDAILDSLDLLDLAERHPMSLSGGQKQRLAIATAIMCGKELIVLDEPTSGLDRRHMMQVGALLRSLADEGRAVLVVTHDEELAALWCDEVIVLGGKAMETGGGVRKRTGR